MKKILLLMFLTILLSGCVDKNEIDLSSSIYFNKKNNSDIKFQISKLGFLDKAITIEGDPVSPFLITVGVSGKRGSASSSSTAEILFELKEGKLSSLMDWQMSGGGERPSLRRESNTEISVYYPTTIDKQRTWVKFKVKIKK